MSADSTQDGSEARPHKQALHFKAGLVLVGKPCLVPGYVSSSGDDVPA
jgi:hypothetical protein